uniref:Methyltransferase-like protein 2 n=3 Tax=Oryza brachyantha TaxID=4533 RepID=J3LL19_ORYBR
MGISESDELRSFEDSGIYRLAGSGAAFLDPVRILNESYRRFRLVPSAYYSRCFGPSHQGGEAETERTEETSPKRKKRKRKREREPKPRELNEVERIAEARHQEARPLLLSAHRSLLKAEYLLEFLPRMTKEDVRVLDVECNLKNFVELGSSWRAPFCEMTLCFHKSSDEDSEEGICHRTSTPLFNSIISVEENDDAEGEFQDRCYILPRQSCFLMSDLKHVGGLIHDNYDQGYNLIVVDPPWENGCVRQKVVYPTLPNRHFLYLPVQELAHSAGALVVLWITNREKLWKFVEEELFPSWGVKEHTVFYWLKVKQDGSLIGDLDLLHHRPYECLLVGYINLNKEDARGSKFKFLEERRVIMSVPGAHSRKPPLQKLLSQYIPGPKPARCIELFARELVSGWTSWGNEPLRFQDAVYFSERKEHSVHS